MHKEPKNRLIWLSIPYLMTVNYITSLPQSPLAASRQFLIARTTGADSPDRAHRPLVMVVSNPHALRVPDDAPDRFRTAERRNPGPATAIGKGQ
jgi:hypothetical protein